ncbi:DinB superfamily protein [Symmachiella dynata]|uniref:DinB superfamily protein n=1 Tax=Symmachiella dynata TaxID=2527995 RepID=A0A517ZH96_9PLAN|nr:DinB family protein [Symmachiella dynata]QDU41822.1 DinB superfamily protein [Symmachiella dynata]
MNIGQTMIPEFDMEMANTRKVLQLVPDEKWDWKIHDKSNTVGWVANHLADIPAWVEKILCHDTLDVEPVEGQPYQSPVETSTAAVLALFDKNVATARQLLETVEDAKLFEPWSLLRQGQELMTLPRLAVLRTWVLNHTIHHRAHLCVYLRVNDVPVPGLYGPSADDAGPA